MADKEQTKAPSVDDLLLMVDFTPKESSQHSHPIIDHFKEVIKHYLDYAQGSESFLGRAASWAKYHAILTAFCSKHKELIDKDKHGQFVKLSDTQKLRPINVKGQALLYGAHYYRVE